MAAMAVGHGKSSIRTYGGQGVAVFHTADHGKVQ